MNAAAEYISDLLGARITPEQVPAELRPLVLFHFGEACGRLWALRCVLGRARQLFQLRLTIEAAIARQPEPMRDGFSWGAQAQLLYRLRTNNRGASR